MSTNSSVMLACPPGPNALPTLKVWMEVNCGMPTDDFDLAIRLGPEGGNYNEPSYLFGAMNLTQAQVTLLRPAVSEGGELYLLGIRARRQMFPPAETTTNEPGKLQVTVIDSGEPTPTGMTAELWATTRLTRDRFLEELGAPGAPLAYLEPPEPAI